MNNTKRKQKETELSGFAIIGNGMHESGHSRKIPYRRAFTFPTPTHLHSLRHATNSRAKWHKVISARLFFSSFFFVPLLRPLPLYPSSPPMHLTASTRTSAEPPFVDGCHVPMPLPSTGRELPSPNPTQPCFTA